MFAYDRLALDVAQQFATSNNGAATTTAVAELVFDCGASSGYGSPGLGGTPLASPPPNAAFQAIEQQLQRLLQDIDAEHEEEQELEPAFPLAVGSAPQDAPPAIDGQAPAADAAQDDGFSAAEIAQFAQLLCSPKKVPPARYQCHICYQPGHYIGDCPKRFNSPYEELTPYQGRKKCYGEFQCQTCKRKWTSQNSVANEAQSCIKCHIAVFPHKQLPVDKAVALGLVKSQRVAAAKIPPIGHGRPHAAAVGQRP